VDETVFSKASMKSLEWSRRRTNLQVDQEKVFTGYHAVIAAVSEENGVELIHIQDRAVNAFDFGRYLGNLSRANGGRPFALFMDNLSAHKTNVMKQMYTRLGITPLYNVPYTPSTNPIEHCFSQVKHHFKSKRLNCLVNDETFNVTDAIRDAFDQIQPQQVRNDVRHSFIELT